MAEYTVAHTEPEQQMVSRWYLFFIGFVLVLFGIAGFVAAGRIDTGSAALVTTSVVWLITAVIALLVAFFVRGTSTVRWTAGIIGALYLLWGAVMLFSAPGLDTVSSAAALAGASGLLILLGALGLAASLVPANWLYRERETMMSSSAT
ncbi:MAG: hypothetical protein ACYC7E_00020 [Armatimonadota bacterium]